MAVRIIKLDSGARRAIPILVMVCALLATFFALKWFIADAAVGNVSQRDVAEVLVYLAPDNPITHNALALILEKSFTEEDLKLSLLHYKKAVELSPYDYRFWLNLGVATDKYADSAEAELYLRKAVELAPHYARARWALGNNLLRQGKTEEAINEIKQAIEADKQISVAAVAVLWQFLNGDYQKILMYIGDSSEARLALSSVLARDGREEEAFLVWNELSLIEKKESELSKELLNHFISKRKFHMALKMLKQMGDQELDFEKIRNPSFEEVIKTKGENIFDWRITDGLSPQIGINRDQKMNGEQSLFMFFDGAEPGNLRFIEQTIAVSPNTEYKLKFFFRTNLKSQNTMFWQIIDANTDKMLGRTDYLMASSDWMLMETSFKTEDKTEAVILRLAYQPCPSPNCSISGKVWFDDFKLEK
ncbi:MAG: hypothetical protein D6735_04540 [Acidobacteria bacterium]|nr:MAG: hypothetical protein D6735_04540 [Acidobacteriota bacterium]